MKLKKLVLWGVSAVLLIVVAAVVGTLYLLSSDHLKQELVAQVQQKTGRTLAIGGKVNVTLSPAPGIRMTQIALSNPPSFDNENLVTADELMIVLNTGALWEGRVEATSAELVRPVIRLSINQQGRNNWEFAGQPAHLSPIPSASVETWGWIAEARAGDAPQAVSAVSWMVKKIRVVDGTLRYYDLRTKRDIVVGPAQLEIILGDAGQPITVTGSAQPGGHPAALAAQLPSLESLRSGQEMPLMLKIDGPEIVAEYAGIFKKGGGQGKLTLSVPSLAKLSGVHSLQPLMVSMAGDVACTAVECAIADGNYALDAINLRGRLGVNWQSGSAAFMGQLTAEAIDLRPYFTKQGAAPPKAWLEPLIASAHAADGQWSTEPFDFSVLKVVRAGIKLNADALFLPTIKTGKIMIITGLTNGILNLSVPEAEFYGGGGAMKMKLDTSQAVPLVEKEITLRKVDALPLLTDAYGFTQVSGKLDARLNVFGGGKSEQEMVSSLAGDGDIKLTNGAVHGFDLASLLRNALLMTEGGETASDKTEFTEFSGTFTLDSGLIKNSDLQLVSPLLNATGAGQISLPLRTVNYELRARLAGKKGRVGGVEVPLLVEGTFEHLKFRPDMTRVVREVLEDPQKVKETVKAVKEQLKETKGAVKDLLKDPNAAKELLGGAKKK